MFSWITCPVCGAVAIGVCCDVLMHDLDDEPDGSTR